MRRPLPTMAVAPWKLLLLLFIIIITIQAIWPVLASYILISLFFKTLLGTVVPLKYKKSPV
jgi:hypothetical protein